MHNLNQQRKCPKEGNQMASSFVSRQRNQQRNTPPVAIKPFVRAAQNFALQTKQNREILDGQGQSVGTEVYTEIRMQGTVLAVRDEGIEDEFGRQYIGLVIQINPDKDRFVQTADPTLHAQILALKQGDLVYVTSEWHRNSSGRGFHARAKTITVLAPASTPGPVAVEAIADALASAA
jgi:hypothetical protein